MNEIWMPGRWLADADRDPIRRLRQERPEGARRRLSVPLTGRWQWRQAADRREDPAAPTQRLKRLARGLRTLLTALGGTAPGVATAGARTGRTRPHRQHPLRISSKNSWLQPLPR